MPQRVITQGKKISAIGPSISGFEVEPSTPAGKALSEGWKITHVSTAIAGEYHISTFVLEKPEEHKRWVA